MSQKPIQNQVKSYIFIGLGIISIILGFLLTPSLDNLMEGFRIQQFASGLLDTNTFHIVGEGNLGAPFVNAGILLILVMLSYLLTKTEIQGGSIAAAFMVFGFGFCGKTIWNVWPLFFGVILYGIVKRKVIASIMPLAWFATALSPMVSALTLYTQYNGTNVLGEIAQVGGLDLAFAIIVGLIAGFLVAIFAEILPAIHKGLTLYNAGMAAGIVGFLFFSIMKTLGIAHGAPAHEYPNINNSILFLCIVILLTYLLVVGLFFRKYEKTENILFLNLYTGDAVKQFGFGIALINMAVCGFACLLYWLLTWKANMHGPLFACLFTVVGFSSNGISLRSMAPIMAGVYCASLLVGGIRGALLKESILTSAFAYVGSKSMLIAAIFGCGMAPVVSRYGNVVGFLAGMIHSFIVPNTGALHGWMNLYNNGFSSGFVVVLFVPAILYILKIKEN